MDLIKKAITEQLEKVLSIIEESTFYGRQDNKSSFVTKNTEDSIIYDYEKGRVFAGNKLAVDIDNLNRYQLIEYLPKSTSNEMWSFEFITVYDTTLIVDIQRVIHKNKSFWSIKFGTLNRGEKNPSLIAEINNVEGYENFINVVNNKFAIKIDPSKY